MQQEKIRIIFFVTLLLAISLLAFFIFLPYVGAIAIAGTLAIIFESLYTKLIRLFRTEALAALFTVILVTIIVLIPLALIANTVIVQAGQLYSDITSDNQSADFIRHAEALIQEKLRAFDPAISFDFAQGIKQILGYIINQSGSLFSGIMSFVFDTLLVVLMFFYFLKDGAKLRRIIISFSPLPDTDDAEILAKLKHAVRSVMFGTLALAIIHGVLTGIGFYMFGIPNGALWGTISGVATIIPVIGAVVVFIPAIAYLFFIGNITGAVGMIVWTVLILTLVHSILLPKLIQRGIHLHPVVILLSVFGGLSLFGIIGFLLGPLVLSLCATLFALYKKQFTS